MNRPITVIAILGYFGISILFVGLLFFLWLRTDPEPAQPIDFPHTVHAGTLGLPCTFCHAFAESSRSATVPPVEKCMDCHLSVATDRPEIRKLARYFEEKRPIEWKRVYAVPEFIYFTHKRHVKAGLACSECHGDVASMKRVRRVGNMRMGWCVSCHRVRNASIDCYTCHK